MVNYFVTGSLKSIKLDMKILSILVSLILFYPAAVLAQDTLKISFEEFVDKAIANSGQIDYEKSKVNLANNRVQQAKDQRILPKLSFQSEHSLVPGVTSPNNLPEEEIYLDPDAINDWDKVGVFTRLRVSGVQPVFTWGAINKAVNAAQIGVKAAQQEFQASKQDYELKLHQLYYSYVLALEIERLIKDADDKVGQIERALNKRQDDAETDESDIFKFKVFKSQFEIQKVEVYQSLEFVKSAWKYALRNEQNTIYEPQTKYLDPVSVDLLGLNYYQNSASINRPELRGLDYGKEAMQTYISSLKAQNLPGLYFGFTTTLASTPIRPRQPNPFISTPENTFNTALGFTIRQNLNFFQANTSLERSKIELRKMSSLRQAAHDGIILQVIDAYKNATIDETRVKKTNEALVTTKEWLTMEQLDYDFGIGEVKDLIDAMKMELELRLKEKESIFDFNSSVVKLNISAGLPLTGSTIKN